MLLPFMILEFQSTCLQLTRRAYHYRLRNLPLRFISQMSSQDPPQREEGSSSNHCNIYDQQTTANNSKEQIPEARRTGVLPTHRKTRLPFKKSSSTDSNMTAQQQAAKRFFESPKFAVAGANADTHRFGYKRTFSGVSFLRILGTSWRIS